MKQTPPESSDSEEGNGLPDFERLMRIKALSHERLAYQRGAWLVEYESLTPEEKAIVDAKFHKMAMKIAAQFGRSRPFIFGSNGKANPNSDDSDLPAKPE